MAESNLNNEEKVVNERIKNGLRKMIKSFDRYIKEATDYEQLEDNLKHMEETDENFHKYDLVEFIHDRIETNIGQTIDKHVNEAFNNLKFDGDIDLQNKIAQKICQDIIKTKDVSEFMNSFKSNVLKANEQLNKNFFSNFIENNSEEVTFLDNENKSTFTNDLEFCSPDNSINHNSFVFFTSEQFPSIAQNLDPSKPDQVRLRAIQQLLAIPASDPQAADHWVDIRKYLNQAFRDKDEKISELCVKLHSRTLASSHYKVSIEIYINLVEHLSEYFKDKELDKRSFKQFNEMSTNENVFILKLLRLINDYSKDVTSKWARYPDTFIETIIDETLKFFSLGNESKFGTCITPVHYLSLLDIQANWFSKWMHGNDSRKVLLNLIKKHETFIQTAINSIIFYSSQNLKKLDPSSQPRGASARKKSSSSTIQQTRTSFRKVEIEYSHFLHSLNVIKKILCFKNGRKLFPIRISNKEINIKELVKILIQIIFDTASYKTENEYSPSKCVYDLLQDLCVAEETCEACLCNEEVIDYLLKPVRTIMQSKKPNHLNSSSSSSFNLNSPSSASSSQNYDESCLLLIGNVLSKIASTECGYKQIMFNNSKENFFEDSKKKSAAHTIASFVRKCLTNQLNYSPSIDEISEYLYLNRLLYSQCQGVFLIKEYNLNKLISECYNLNDKETINTPRSATNQQSKWSDSLLDNLINMASTPKGVYYLNETQLLDKAITYLFNRYKSKLQVGKNEKFGYGFLISELANSPSGCFYFNESQLIQSLIDEIWIELECGTDDFMSAFPRAYSVEPVDREVYKPMLCLINILSSFSSVYDLLADISVTPRCSYAIRDLPKGLVGLLDRVTFLDKKKKISSLCNFEQSHLFGLKLLSILQCDLDLLLLFETQFDSSNILLTLQKSNRPVKFNLDYENSDENRDLSNDEDYDELKNVEEVYENPNIIIDQLSVERNFVLVNSNLIGGPNEKILPIKNFDDPKKFTYNFPIFDQLPVPSFYTKKPDFNRYQKRQEFENFIEKFNIEEIIKSKEPQSNWINEFKNIYLKCLKSSNLSIDIMATALNQFVQIYTKFEQKKSTSSIDMSKNLTEFKSQQNLTSVPISPLQKLGIEKTIQYGIQINQIQKNQENLNNLIELQKFVKVLLKTSNSKSKKINKKEDNYLAFCQEEFYPGHDWFTSTIYLLNKGDLNNSLKFLFNFHFVDTSCFLWTSRLYSNDFLLSSVFNQNGINVLLPTTCHYIELILKIELPLIFSAFRMSGLAPSQICSIWLKQCFWNYLDWCDIVTYLSLCIIYGVDYQTYFCVTILKHLNDFNHTSNIIQHHTNRDLQIYLKENQIKNFKIEDHIDFMFNLEKKYRSFIFNDIEQLLNFNKN